MGLDMYLVTRKDYANKEEEPEVIHYWRKHNALHAWMKEEWNTISLEDYIKNGKIPVKLQPDDVWWEEVHKESFNCIPLFLNEEMLIKLRNDIKNKKLEPTSGFFWGPADYDPSEDAEDDLEAIKKALQALEEGLVVAYDSWW